MPSGHFRTSRTVDDYGLIQSDDSAATGVSLQSGTLNNYLAVHPGGQQRNRPIPAQVRSPTTDTSKPGRPRAADRRSRSSRWHDRRLRHDRVLDLQWHDDGCRHQLHRRGNNHRARNDPERNRRLRDQFRWQRRAHANARYRVDSSRNVQGGTARRAGFEGIGTESVRGSWRSRRWMQRPEWNLTGAGAFTTSADVQSDYLHVSGALTTPTVTVASAGTLGGAGRSSPAAA